MMAWNAENDQNFALAYEAEYKKQMSNLKIRTRYLVAYSDQAATIRDFTKAAPIWASERKSLDRVESFLSELLVKKYFDAHKACLSVWAKEIQKRPASFNYFLSRKTAQTYPSSERLVNPAFSKDDSFDVITGYLALDPVGCLSQNGLLSGSWVDLVGKPENRDYFYVSIMSAASRYVKQMTGLKFITHEDGFRSEGWQSSIKELGILIENSCGLSVKDLLSKVKSYEDSSSKAVLSFYEKGILNCDGFYSDRSIGYAVNSPAAIMLTKWFFDVAVKARVHTNKENIKLYQKKFSSDSDEQLFMLYSTSPDISPKVLMSIFEPKLLTKGMISEVMRLGISDKFISLIPEECRYDLIQSGVIPVEALKKGRDKGIALESSLGL